MARIRVNFHRYDLSVRDERLDRGGEVAPINGDMDALGNGLSRHILLFIHGFNDTREDADDAYATALQIYQPDLRAPRPDAVVCFQWPGDIAVGPFKIMDAFGYPYDITQAKKSARELAGYITSLCHDKGVNFRISVLAHSMGCRVALEMLKILSPAVAAAFEVVGLMAAAVPVDLVAASAANGYPADSLCGTDRLVRKMIKFYSWLDPVLALAFPAGESAAFVLGIEPAEFIEAVGHLGNPPGFGVDDGRSTNDLHGQYWGDKKVKAQMIAALDPTKPAPRPVRMQTARALPTPTAIACRELAAPRKLA